MRSLTHNNLKQLRQNKMNMFENLEKVNEIVERLRPKTIVIEGF